MTRGVKSICSAVIRRKSLREDVLDTELRRCLSLFSVILLGVGHMIGIGIYVLVGEVTRNMAGPGIVFSFMIAGFVSLLAAMCYAEFGSWIPKAGSAYTYSYVTLGELIGFMVGWNVVAENVIGCASSVRSMSGYLRTLLASPLIVDTGNGSTISPASPTSTFQGVDMTAFALAVLCTILMLTGIHIASIVNNIFVIINLGVILLFVGLSLPYADLDNWSNFTPFGVEGVITGASSCFFAYLGFESISAAGEEAKNPSKVIPIATLIAMGIVTVCYIAMSCSLTLMVPRTAIDPLTAFASAFGTVGNPTAKHIVAVGALIALTTVTYGGFYTMPRSIYCMAQDGLLPKFLGNVSRRTMMPSWATIVGGLSSGLLGCLMNLNDLVELIAYTFVAVGVIVLRYKPMELDGAVRPNEATALADSVNSNSNLKLKGTLKPRFKKWFPAYSEHPYEPGNLVVFCVAVMLLSILSAWVLLSNDIGFFWLRIGFGGSLALLAVLSYAVICMHHQSSYGLIFKTPFSPLIPTLSIVGSCFLIANLNYKTWIRLTVWIAFGLAIYFGYGIHHSVQGVLNESDKARALKPKKLSSAAFTKE